MSQKRSDTRLIETKVIRRLNLTVPSPVTLTDLLRLFQVLQTVSQSI